MDTERNSLLAYLQSLRFAAGTINMYQRYAKAFLQWLDAENVELEGCRYADLMGFVEQLKNDGKSLRNINQYMLAIRHLYDAVGLANCPAANVVLRGVSRHVPADLLDEKQLADLLERYTAYDLRTKRNKVILGLLVHQALTTGELQKLRTEHLKTDRGKIIVPSTPRTNGRTLELKAGQVVELHEYVTVVRPQLLANAKTETDRLFVSMEGHCDLRNSLHHLFRAVKKLDPKVRNAKQVRMSVIRNKLKTNGLRQVQHFAGHKWVSSTERYLIGHIDELQRDVEKYHPLDRIDL